MDTTLIELSDSKSQIANNIFEETNILEIFSCIGHVEIVGSLKLNLMYRNDIDLLVFSDEIQRTKASQVNTQIINTNKFQTVGLANYQDYPQKGLPSGYYWELIIQKNGQEWKFDVWYLKPDEEYSKLVMNSIKSFEKVLISSPEKREIILRIKDAYHDGIKYKDKVKSIDIYKAVIDNNVSSVDEFVKFQNDNNN